ncbi:MAG TPA: phenylalanine--tRNA ligase subunit alpha [Terriglobales bacterium]|nr:phenylalanine--tRNA ligase subunit alpha [Terriglobales bacterium]
MAKKIKPVEVIDLDNMPKPGYTVPKLTDFSASALDSAVRELLSGLDQEAEKVSSDSDWKAFRDRWMARKNGILTQLNDLWLKAAPTSNKPHVGQRVNGLRKTVEGMVEVTQKRLLFNKAVATEVVHPGNEVPAAELEAYAKRVQLAAQRLDVTLPGIRRPMGAEHPVIKTMNEIIGVFRNLGYSVEEGPEIETDYYNFEALNFPPNHPARDTQDTLFIAGQESKPLRDRLLLRTHTSPVQIRTMQKMKPPVRVVCPGKVHRNDAADATHSPIFHQVEGLAVDTNITFCDLKGTLDHAMKALFGSSVKTRFYPSFFPFTEPSADVQISCIFCDGKGTRDGAPCRNCKASGWIELLGCGMVDPNVYGFVDYDATKVSGFAFGMGVERIAILKYGVDDIQLFFQGDVRFLEQFG